MALATAVRTAVRLEPRTPSCTRRSYWPRNRPAQAAGHRLARSGMNDPARRSCPPLIFLGLAGRGRLITLRASDHLWLVPDAPAPDEVAALRAANARLREVIGAKDTEIGMLREQMAAWRGNSSSRAGGGLPIPLVLVVLCI